MSKTDKELTIELVTAFIQSWNAKTNTTALKTDDATDLIEAVYNSIHSLENSPK